MTRFATEPARNSLKTATRKLMALLGGTEAASTVTRVVKSKLHGYGDVNAADRFMPVDVLLDLELCVRDPVITQALAACHGYVLLPVEMPGEGDISIAMQAVAKDAGATLQDALRALSGDLAAPELRLLQSDLVELIRASTRCLGNVNHRLGVPALSAVPDAVEIPA